MNLSSPSTTPHHTNATENEVNVHTDGAPSLHDLFLPVTLPCGRTIRNRLVKVALYEHMAALLGGPPNTRHFDLYSRWSAGKWGMIMTGNVQVSRRHLTLGRDVVVPDVLTPKNIEPFARLATAIHGTHVPLHSSSAGDVEEPLAIMQLSHTGRQSPNFIGGRLPFKSPLAASAIPLDFSRRGNGTQDSIGRTLSDGISWLMHKFMFQTSLAMSTTDIETVVGAFVRGAQLAARSGFDGIELHAAHGYLIAGFLSPKSNAREDEYSKPLELLCTIVSTIRAPGIVPSNFVLGIKLNAADYVDTSVLSSANDTADEERVLSHVRDIANWKMVDFIEVSGGTYEDPKFSSSASKRQALFARFSRRALSELTATCGDNRPLVLLTGGLATTDVFISALKQQHADLLGIGRLSVLQPELPKLLEDTLSPGSKTDVVGTLDNSPLVRGLKPWDTQALHTPASLTARTARQGSRLLCALWSLIPSAAKPEFPKLIGAGMDMAWYTVAMRHLATNSQPDVGDGLGAIIHMWTYVAPGDYNLLPPILVMLGTVVTMIAFLLYLCV